MSEVALLALDLFLVSYCCWIVFRVGKKPEVRASDFGIFAYKENPEKADQ
ncbi:hypothetical protein HUU62_12660 [Rhodoferax sp. 4810]|nr:hypothetical protein [Rhodoferax jenense]